MSDTTSITTELAKSFQNCSCESYAEYAYCENCADEFWDRENTGSFGRWLY